MIYFLNIEMNFFSTVNRIEYLKIVVDNILEQFQNLDYELLIADGGSTDGTVEVIKEYEDQISVFISEPDEGIYDSLNKGIMHASGTVIGILHSDDIFCDEHVVSEMITKMSDTKSEFCFSDMVIVDDESGKVVRYYMANYFKKWMFRIGWMPPHPTCFINRSLFDEFGLYSTKYKIAGDFDFFVRIFYGREINWTYLDRITVRMRKGGVSNSGWKSKILIANEISHSLQSNQVWSLHIFQLARYFIRLMEMVAKPIKACG